MGISCFQIVALSQEKAYSGPRPTQTVPSQGGSGLVWKWLLSESGCCFLSVLFHHQTWAKCKVGIRLLKRILQSQVPGLPISNISFIPNRNALFPQTVSVSIMFSTLDPQFQRTSGLFGGSLFKCKVRTCHNLIKRVYLQRDLRQILATAV